MSIEVKGLKELTATLNKYPEKVQKNVDEALTEGAQSVQDRATMLAPEGVTNRLKNSIISKTDVFLHKEITDPVFYAPFMEFGTGKQFRANGRASIAAQYQGKSNRGNIEDFVKSLALWIRKKGISGNARKKVNDDDRYIAYWMAIRILQNGIKPANKGTGYFFRAYDEILPTILRKVQEAIK